MLIENPCDLTDALKTTLTNQVVVRNAVQRQGYPLTFDAELALLYNWGGQDYLGHATVFVCAGDEMEIKSDFSAINLTENPRAIEEMCAKWSWRPFDDWMHDRPFMGAYGVYLDRMPHTSIKRDATDSRWHLLTGVVLGELARLQLYYAADTAATQGILLMRKRFSAFVAQIVLNRTAQEFFV